MRQLALVLLIVSAAWAAGPRSTSSGQQVHVQDTAIGTTWEIVTADTGGFTQMSADSVLRIAWGPESKFDSVRTGNLGGGTARAVWSGGSTADTAGTNFWQDRGQTSPAADVAGVFGNGFSGTWGSYLIREEDSDFRVNGNWTITCWAKGSSPGNPGLGTKQIVFSAYESPDFVQVGFDQNGYVFARLSDDYGSNWDSLGVKADKYDGAFHYIALQVLSKAGHAANKDSIRLTVDDSTKGIVFSNASTSLTPDTVSAFAFRGANLFQGLMDEIQYLEDSITVDQDYRPYAWRAGREALGLSTDSAAVHLMGVGTDSARVDTMVKLGMQSPATTSRRWHAFETAYLDSEEAMPVVIYTSAVTPRTTQLDSIPAGKLNYDIAQLMGQGDPKRARQRLKRVTFQHEGAIDSSDWELRVYPSIEDTRDLTDGYWVAATARLHGNSGPYTQDLDLDLEAEPGSNAAFVVVYAKGTASTKGSATLEAEKR
uniref:Lectin/glucanase superfamily protein n=1 Tax=viral metagenome TaxID=1070528 RepID=A0A6M3J3C0_9ZZZZ